MAMGLFSAPVADIAHTPANNKTTLNRSAVFMLSILSIYRKRLTSSEQRYATKA
jgi:hypothetical protein